MGPARYRPVRDEDGSKLAITVRGSFKDSFTTVSVPREKAAAVRAMSLSNADDLLTPEQAAAMLSVSPATLERWRAHRPIYGPAFIMISARIIRYRRMDLQAYIEASVRR